MKPRDRDLVAFLEEEVLPHLTPADIFPSVKWTSTSGRYWRGPCPLHGGDNPTAFSVDFITKRWTCFSGNCGNGPAVAGINGGTIPTGRGFVDAVRRLAEKAGVPFPERERTEEEVKRAEERDRHEALLQAFLVFVQNNLRKDNGTAAQGYLDRRGLTGYAAEDLGLYPTRKAIQAALSSKGFTEDEVMASGVVHDPRWEGRLIIPWRDRYGRLGTFAARDLTEKAKGADKYLYMTTEKGWAKKKADLVAFGLDLALQKRPSFLVLVEGLLDVVNLQTRGFLNVAAIGGKGHELKPERWEALAAYGVSSVVLVLDNDPAEDGTWPGLEGTLAAVENAQKVNNSGNVRNVPVLYVVHPYFLGDCKDPDAFVHKYGVEAFRSILDKREPSSLFMGKAILGDVTPESPAYERETAAAKLTEYAGTLYGDRATFAVEDLLSLAAEKTGYSIEAMKDEAKRQEELRRREERERLVDMALREANSKREMGADPEEITETLMETLSSVKVQTLDPPPPFSVDRMEQMSKEAPAGKSSGWKALDDGLEVSFNPGELTVIGGRTGHCKTSVLVGLLVNWLKATEGKNEDEVLVFYSQEEHEVRIYHRLLGLLATSPASGWSTAEVRDFKRGGWGSRSDDYEWKGTEEALNEARETLRRWEDRLLIVHRPAWSVEKIEAHARDLAKRRPLGAVLVDYLQRIPPPTSGRYDRRDIEVSTVARRLKSLSEDLSAPVVAGGQINRDSVPDKYRENLAKAGSYEKAKETIKKARPLLSHLREGGAEQEADLVLGLLSYGADFQTEEADLFVQVPDVTLLEVGTLKNRYGATGRWAALAFEGRFNLIRDPSSRGEV